MQLRDDYAALEASSALPLSTRLLRAIRKNHKTLRQPAANSSPPKMFES